MRYRVLRWAGMLAAVVCCLLIAVLHELPIIEGGVLISAGRGDLFLYDDQLRPDASGFVKFFLFDDEPWSVVGFFFAVTAGLRSARARFAAALVLLVPILMLVGRGSDNRNWQPYEHSAPAERVVHDQLAVVGLVAAAALLVGVVLLLVRLYSAYSALGIVALVALGGYELVGPAALAGAVAGADLRVLPAAWLPGVVHLLAAGFAAVAWVGAVRMPQPVDPAGRPVGGLWGLVRQFGQSVAVGVRGADGRPGFEALPQYRLLLVCGLVGGLLTGLALVAGLAGDSGIDVDLPSGPDLPVEVPR